MLTTVDSVSDRCKLKQDFASIDNRTDHSAASGVLARHLELSRQSRSGIQNQQASMYNSFIRLAAVVLDTSYVNKTVHTGNALLE
jgi:hypothetical protein